ncbi:hypothetical protein GCM10027037_12510 [Mucilaginibacter koreensis]
MTTQITKLFVGGFPLEMDEMGLARLIALHGEIETIKIVVDRKTRLCKGYAFVEVKSIDDAYAVMIALDGHTLADRQLTIKLAEQAMPIVSAKSVDKQKTNYSNDKAASTNYAGKPKRPRKQRW